MQKELTDDEREEQGQRNRDEEADRYAHERFDDPVYMEAREWVRNQEKKKLTKEHLAMMKWEEERGK